MDACDLITPSNWLRRLYNWIEFVIYLSTHTFIQESLEDHLNVLALFNADSILV